MRQFWTHGIKMTNTANCCQKLNGFRKVSFNTINHSGSSLLHCNKRRKQSEREVYENFHWMQSVYKYHWIIAVTPNRRSRHAKGCTNSIQRSVKAESNRSLQSNKFDKGVINNLKASDTIIDLKHPQDRNTILLPQRIRLQLRHHDGNQGGTCGQRGTGIRGNLHLGVICVFSFWSFQMQTTAIDGEYKQ